MLGFVALSCLLIAIIAGFLVYQIMKAIWHLPIMLNFPGAALVSVSVLAFTSWLTHDLLSASFIGPQPPDMPWNAWLIYLGLAIWFYSNIWVFLVFWSRKSGKPKYAYFNR